MGSVEMSCLDLECGGSHSSAVKNNGKDENICFSIPERNSCGDSEVNQVMHARRESSEVGSDCIVNIENGVYEVRIFLGTMERECRICMLSLDSESIELGCSCKSALGAAHQHCAEKWFKSKGNKICEICKSIAQNIVIPSDTESRQHIRGVNRFSTNAVPMLRDSISTTPTQHHTSSTNAVEVIEPDTNSSDEEDSESMVWVFCELCLCLVLVSIAFFMLLFYVVLCVE